MGESKLALGSPSTSETSQEPFFRSVSFPNETRFEVSSFVSPGADVDPEDVNGRTPIVIANFLPIDEAVTLMAKLITDSGKTPKKSPGR